MTQIYVLQQLPSTCWIEEAARWVAFGTVPNLSFWEAEERRLSPEFMEENEPEIDIFYQEDFESQGIEIDYERYLSSRLDIYHRSSEAFIERRLYAASRQDIINLEDEIEKARRSISDPSALELEIRSLQEAFGSVWADDEWTLAELEWLEAQEEPLETIVNFARLKLVEKLMAGEIDAMGWVVNRQNDWQRNSDGDETGELDGVPKAAWGGFTFIRETGELRHKGKTYRHVQVNTDRLMEAFPRPLFSKPLAVQAEKYPGCLFLADAETVSHQVPKMRRAKSPGRPSVAGGAIRDATVYHTRHKLLEERKSNPGEGIKVEFALQTMIDYAMAVHQHPLPGSTAKDWLRPLREDKDLRNIWRSSGDT